MVPGGSSTRGRGGSPGAGSVGDHIQLRMAKNEGSSINSYTIQNQIPPQNSNSNLNPQDLPSSPYFIGTNENSGSLLVTQMLNSTNYHSWARSMKRALQIKNKLGFIDGSICEPIDVDSPLMEHWLRCYDIVITWMQNTMTVNSKATQQNAPRIYEVKQGIAELVQGQDSVSTYFSKLKTLLDELMNYESIPNCTCGRLKTVVSNQERDWVMKFLMGLNDSYKILKAQILLIKPVPKLNEVYSIIQQEENRRDISIDSPTTDGMALVSRSILKEAEKKKSKMTKEIFLHILQNT
ncbi:uncharacterized protein LOC111366973 [Olea europaea var. sylvestris]|uniref:uncharacterized protein LOC111366973 n=1 Tax=Olea europaea var. sylvestris TaxID=158386 RepID=UPI000C1CFD51|nr:uncharacterized protein LOC111366973 [Olea europaea var. sylvestris]